MATKIDDIELLGADNETDRMVRGKIGEYVANMRELASMYKNPWDILAVDWPHINQSSTVVEVGGYTGRWSLQILERYNPNLFIFEPQKWCCLILQDALRGYKAKICPYALGIKDSTMIVFQYGTDGCTLNSRQGLEINGKEVPIKEMGKSFSEEGIGKIDLMMMNIEGYEFDLIPYMLKIGIVPDTFIIQFHGHDKMMDTRKMMEKYYSVLWDYGEILSAWKANSHSSAHYRGKR